MRCFALMAFLLASLPAHAHIIASPNTAESGAWFRTALRVSHGCEDSDTRQITVTVPSEVLIIKPQIKPGWTIDIQKEKLEKPVQGPHGPITEVTRKIVWTGNLPDAYFDEFGLTMKLPEKTGTILLPTKQTCVKGEMNWNGAPLGPEHQGHDMPDYFPAPVITLTPKAN